MAEDPRFLLHFKTLAKFKEKLADGTVSENRHLVFIKDEKLLWCRGIYYADASKLDNFNSYYNDWEITQSDTNILKIKLKGNQWNSTTRKWEAISKELTFNSATGSIAGLMSALDKRQVDIIDTANFKLEDPTTTATTVTIHASHTDVNGEARNLKTSKTLSESTVTNAGVMSNTDKIVTANLKTAGDTVTELNAYTRTATSVTDNYKTISTTTADASVASGFRTVPMATVALAGMMDNTDKILSLNLKTLGAISHVSDDSVFTKDANTVLMNFDCISASTSGDTISSHTVLFPVSTDTQAGVITGTEHKLLNTDIPNNIAQEISDRKAAISALDYTDAAVTNQFVTAVSETDGVISVSRARPSAGNISNTAITASTTQVGLAGTDVLTTIGNIATAIKTEQLERVSTVSAEALARSNADTTLTSAIASEISRAKTAEEANATAISSEAATRASADTTLTNSLNSHTGNTSNPHSVTKSQVGLGNVTNDSQVKRSEMGVASGVATLDANSKVVQVANSADKLNTDAGSATNPVYFSSGVPVACTYSLNKTVPSDAKFSDTTYAEATQLVSGLMSASDKTKLNGIAPGANAYTHPTHTAASSGFYKVTVDGLGHVSATTAVTKSDITGLGIPGSDTTYSFLEGSTNGTFSVTPSGGSATDVSIKGLGTAAYTASTAYATATQGSNADTAYGWGNHANAGYTKNTGTVTQVNIGTTAYTPKLGVITLPLYPSYSIATTEANGLMSSTDKTWVNLMKTHLSENDAGKLHVSKCTTIGSSIEGDALYLHSGANIILARGGDNSQSLMLATNAFKPYAENEVGESQISLGLAGSRFANVVSRRGDFSDFIKVATEDNVAPFIITSNKLVTNLNADMLDGKHLSEILEIAGGGSAVGDAITLSGKTIDDIYAEIPSKIDLATSSQNGLMSKTDKKFLEDNKFVTNVSFDGEKLSLTSKKSGSSSSTVVTVPTATTSAAGLLSASDKTKLDNIRYMSVTEALTKLKPFINENIYLMLSNLNNTIIHTTDSNGRIVLFHFEMYDPNLTIADDETQMSLIMPGFIFTRSEPIIQGLDIRGIRYSYWKLGWVGIKAYKENYNVSKMF